MFYGIGMNFNAALKTVAIPVIAVCKVVCLGGGACKMVICTGCDLAGSVGSSPTACAFSQGAEVPLLASYATTALVAVSIQSLSVAAEGDSVWAAVY